MQIRQFGKKGNWRQNLKNAETKRCEWNERAWKEKLIKHNDVQDTKKKKERKRNIS